MFLSREHSEPSTGLERILTSNQVSLRRGTSLFLALSLEFCKYAGSVDGSQNNTSDQGNLQFTSGHDDPCQDLRMNLAAVNNRGGYPVDTQVSCKEILSSLTTMVLILEYCKPAGSLKILKHLTVVGNGGHFLCPGFRSRNHGMPHNDHEQNFARSQHEGSG
ncbi:hypothetical protein PRBEI_2001824800 [Prionailurus iriomotensis]